MNPDPAPCSEPESAGTLQPELRRAPEAIVRGESDIRTPARKGHPVLLRHVMLAVSALTLNLAFAPFPLRFLSLVALVPLFWAIDQESPSKSFRYGLFFGAVFFIGHLWWLYALVVPVERVTRVLLNVGVTLLFGYLGLFTALFALIVRRIGLFWAPFVWAALEWVRSQSEMGFPWGLLGTSLTPYTPMIQGASFIGVYGISALVVLINLLVYKCLFDRRKARFALSLIVAFALPLVFGLLRIDPVQKWFRVGVVQPDVSPFDKGARASREEIWRDMLRLSRQAAAEGAQVLLYPETATLSDITRKGEFRDSLQALSDSLNVPIVTGTPLYGDYGYANATTVIAPNRPDSLNATGPARSPLQVYCKVHLAPFSEHFPFVGKVPFLRRIMTGDMGDCTPGRTLNTLSVRQIRFATPICFEGIFPEQIRRFARNGAQAIMVVTNDGWFGRTPGPYQHCELMIMRAVENGIPLIRAANNGISLVADPYGKILRSTSLFVQTQITQDVPLPLSRTPYTRTGDVFSHFSLVLTGLLVSIRLVQAGFRRARSRTQPAPQ